MSRKSKFGKNNTDILKEVKNFKIQVIISNLCVIIN
jgi:hypothetical protein